MRVSTTPSTGERITVRCRLSRAVCGRRLLLGDLRLRGIDLRARLVARGAGQVGIAARDQLLLRQSRLAGVVGFGVAQRGLRAGEVGARAADGGGALRDLRLVGARIDPREHLALADVVVEVDQHRR